MINSLNPLQLSKLLSDNPRLTKTTLAPLTLKRPGASDTRMSHSQYSFIVYYNISVHIAAITPRSIFYTG